MPSSEEYEILVLGSGEAGKFLAWTMARAGHRTVLVERKWFGGSCPNIAYLPSNNLIYSAKVASLARRGAEFGLTDGFTFCQHGGRSAPQTIDGRGLSLNSEQQSAQCPKRCRDEDAKTAFAPRAAKQGKELRRRLGKQRENRPSRKNL